ERESEQGSPRPRGEGFQRVFCGVQQVDRAHGTVLPQNAPETPKKVYVRAPHDPPLLRHCSPSGRPRAPGFALSWRENQLTLLSGGRAPLGTGGSSGQLGDDLLAESSELVGLASGGRDRFGAFRSQRGGAACSQGAARPSR